ncbi:hypothetical protein I546_3644 [Mycobacterium kansasii 732]|nr:hypothetical protein I546_3644 [Mycobacterium kansasii 732]
MGGRRFSGHGLTPGGLMIGAASEQRRNSIGQAAQVFRHATVAS